MNKMKLVFAAIAALVGIGGAYATKAAKPGAVHVWVNGNNETVVIATTVQAKSGCPGEALFCLRAKDAPSLILRSDIGQ